MISTAVEIIYHCLMFTREGHMFVEVDRKSIIKTETTSYSEKILETDRKEEIGHFKINLLINSNYIFNMEASRIHKIIEVDILKTVYHYTHCLWLYYGKKKNIRQTRQRHQFLFTK